MASSPDRRLVCGLVQAEEEAREVVRGAGSTGRQSLNAQLNSRSRRRDWQGWRGGKSGSPLQGTGGPTASEAEDQDLRRAMKEEPGAAAVVAAAMALSTPAAPARTVTSSTLASPGSPAHSPAVTVPPALGGAFHMGPASPNTLARQLEMLTGPPPPMTMANLLAWRYA